jgi:Protein of unknown function (DUF2802)
MNILLAMISLLSAVALTAAAVSVFALKRAHGLLHQLNSPRPTPPGDVPNDLQEIRGQLQLLASQVQEFQKQPPAVFEQGALKSGLNLTKRSQALRMHRRGESVDQIATALDLPRQEIDLLLKVHRIVLSNV